MVRFDNHSHGPVWVGFNTPHHERDNRKQARLFGNFCGDLRVLLTHLYGAPLHHKESQSPCAVKLLAARSPEKGAVVHRCSCPPPSSSQPVKSQGRWAGCCVAWLLSRLQRNSRAHPLGTCYALAFIIHIFLESRGWLPLVHWSSWVGF